MNIGSRFVVPGIEDFLELQKNNKSIIINRAISPSLKHIPGAISEDKITCNYILQKNGFPVPDFIFSDNVGDTESEFLKENSPIVAKPYDTNKGVEIHMDIRTLAQLEKAMRSIKKTSDKAILQKQARGKDYRILIIDKEVVGVLWNEWPFIITDGIHTIEELIAQENERRTKTKIDVYGKPTGMLVDIPLESLDSSLKKIGLTREDIPAKREKIHLGQCGNGWAGSISHDVTELMHPSILEKALEITDFMDIDVAGLDVRCMDIASSYQRSGFNFIEVNIRPSLVDHEFPFSGKGRNVTEKYLEYLFK